MLSLLQGALSLASDAELVRLFCLVKPHPDLPGLHLVLPRLSRVMPWAELLCIKPAERYAGLGDLTADLCRPETQAIWQPTAPAHQSAFGHITNILAGAITRFPHYAIYTELPGDRSGEQECRVAPLIALYTILSNARLLAITPARAAGTCIRRLLNPSNPEARALRERFPQMLPDPWAAQELFHFVAGEHSALRRLVELASKSVHRGSPPRPPKIKRRRRRRPWPGGPPPPGLLPGPKPPVDVEGSEPEPPDGIEAPPTIIEIPPGSPLEPAMAIRKWSAWSEMQHQHLYWQWRALNPHEIARIRDALAELFEAREVLGLLLGLSLATARDALDVLAIQLDSAASQSTDLAGLDCDYFLNVPAGIIVHSSALPGSSYTPSEAEAGETLLPVANSIGITLPTVLADACRHHLPSLPDGDIRLGEALHLSASAVQTMVRDWCERIRRDDPRVRVSPARLREWPVYRALYRSRDLALVAHLFLLELPGSALLHYAGFSATRLQALHAAVMEEVFGGAIPRDADALPIGSRLAVRPEALRDWIRRWQRELTTLADTRSLAGMLACHNALVRYTLVLLMRWSGHRAVGDPFDRLHRFDADTGTALIADKMTGDADQARLAWLPPVAFTQLEVYRAHLQALGRRIAAHEPVLAGRIAHAGTADSDLSLFFFLDIDGKHPVPSMITPSRLQAELALPVPLYFGRNALSQNLPEQGLEAEYVAYQLHHVQRGQDPMGRWSTLRIDDVGTALRPQLARAAEEEGWNVLRGLRTYPTPPGRKRLPQATWVPGPQRRARQRTAHRRERTRRLREVLATAPAGPWDRSAVAALRSAIDAAFPQAAQRRSAYRVARRWMLRNHPEARKAVEKEWPQLLEVPVEPGRFQLDDGLRLQAYRRCRRELRGWLPALSETSPLAEWDGALLACALLEEALLGPEYLAQLPRSVRVRASAWAGIAWVDLDEKAFDPPATRRLFLSPLTGLLVVRFRKMPLGRSSSFSVAARAAVRRLLPGGDWDDLCAIAETGARYRLSGVEYCYATGELTAASLPVTALLRLLTGHLLTDSAVAPLPAESKRRRAPATPRPTRSPDYQLGLRYRAALRRQLHRLVDREARLADPRRQLARFLDRLASSAPQHAPPVIPVLIAWVRRLLDQGRKKERLALSTIRDYYLAIARYVYEAAWTVEDFSALEEDELEDIYGTALELTTWRQRPATAHLLRDFHNGLRRHFRGTPSIDFHVVEPRLKGRSVRSNLLTLAEYARARNQLELPERVALTCLYRLGLRPGEVRRLAPNDIWPEGDGVLYVRSRRGARTKTAAGQRQIPLAGRISAEERTEIHQLLVRCRDAGLTLLSHLMPSDTLARITAAMRAASGDYELVPYHLRHAARTQMLLWATLEKESALPGTEPAVELIAGPIDFRRAHFGCEAPTRRSGYQEVAVAGHASPSTTYGTYAHLLDWMCHQAVRRDHPVEDALLAHLSGFRTANVRQIRRRAGEAAGGGQAVLAQVLKQDGLAPPPELARMVPPHVPTAPAPPRRSHPTSLLDVSEALRLWGGGQGIADIADRFDYEEAVVQGWIDAAQGIIRLTGYPIAALSARHFSAGRTTEVVEQTLSDALCQHPGSEPQWLLTWLQLWTQRYIHRLGMPYFSDLPEILEWIGGLLRLEVAPEEIRLMVPRNVDDGTRAATLAAVQEQGVGPNQVRRQHRSVNARSAAATRDPGLGVTITRGPGHNSLAKILARSLFCAAVVWES